MILRRTFLIFLTLLGFSTLARSQVIHGEVVAISDGDTVTLLISSKHTIEVRLQGIDAPEKGQNFSEKAKGALSTLVFGRTVALDIEGRDRYGRTLGSLYVNGLNVNLELVKMGLAWHYRRYSNDRGLAEAEAIARRAGMGLWSMPNPIPPWEYRRAKK